MNGSCFILMLKENNDDYDNEVDEFKEIKYFQSDNDLLKSLCVTRLGCNLSKIFFSFLAKSEIQTNPIDKQPINNYCMSRFILLKHLS